MSGLKPCPFCGIRLVYVDEMMGFYEHPQLSSDCILALRVVDLEAVEMWNRRAEQVEAGQQPATEQSTPA